MKIHFRSLQYLLVAIMLAACAPAPQPWHGTEVTGILPDLEFELTAGDGSRVSHEDFRGQPTLVFFGFTACPEACPATLARLGLALQTAGEVASHVQVLLVSVDPDRDTPAAMAAYTRSFGPWLYGLTGDEAELRALRERYHVAAQALPADGQGRYDVMHGLAVLAFDASGRCRLLISDTSDTQALAADLRRLARESA